jgi:hypothetical protein
MLVNPVNFMVIVFEEYLENASHDFFERFADFGPTLQSSLKDECQKIVVTEQVREQGWSDTTDNDRLSLAFAALKQQGIFAVENLGTTLQDGWAYAGIQSNQTHRGVVFFHSQDVITAVNSEGLYLAYGVIDNNEKIDDDTDNIKLASMVVAILTSNGLTVRWSGAVTDRLLLAPFEWRKRRWTAAPSDETSPIGKHVKTNQSPVQEPLPQHALRAAANRIEHGFHLQRTQWLQRRGADINPSVPWQVGSLGTPTVFVQWQEFTSFMPQPAINNQATRLAEYFARGVQARPPDRLIAKTAN